MCRIAAYLGPSTRLAALLDDPPRGLAHQSRNARMMSSSSVAGDGWAVGWFLPEGGPTPGLLKSILPLWSDENGRTVPHAIRSGSIVGHVRLASPDVESCLTNTPLDVLDDLLSTINGMLEPWPGPPSKALRDRLDPDHEADFRGSTDGEMLGGLWRTQLHRTGGRDAALALRSTLREARDLARRHHGEIRTNIILRRRRRSGRGAVRRAPRTGHPVLAGPGERPRGPGRTAGSGRGDAARPAPPPARLTGSGGSTGANRNL